MVQSNYNTLKVNDRCTSNQRTKHTTAVMNVTNEKVDFFMTIRKWSHSVSLFLISTCTFASISSHCRFKTHLSKENNHTPIFRSITISIMILRSSAVYELTKISTRLKFSTFENIYYLIH